MHVNRRHKRVKCPQCEKRFVKQADCDNHVRDVHKFVCSISGCSVFKYNEIELHEHLRYDHRCKMVFRCNKCVKVFSARSELHQHHEVDHGRVKLVGVQGEKYPCPRCIREYLSKSMLVIHSRDHKENVYGCCRGALNNKELGLWCRRGLLAHVYTGVSVLLKYY